MTNGLKTEDGGRKTENRLAGSKRLDALLSSGMVKDGARFLFKGHQDGDLREGALLERSPDGHVRLDDSGRWLWPEEIFVEELLPLRPPAPDRLGLILEDLATIIGLLQKLAGGGSQARPAAAPSSFSVPISGGKPAAGPHTKNQTHKSK